MFIREGMRMLVEKNLRRERGIQGVENSVTWGCLGWSGWAALYPVNAEEKNDEVVYPYPGVAYFFLLAVEGAKIISTDLK